MPAQTNTKKAILLWPLSSSQKITGTEMMRPSVMKFGILMITGGRSVVGQTIVRARESLRCQPGSQPPELRARSLLIEALCFAQKRESCSKNYSVEQDSRFG